MRQRWRSYRRHGWRGRGLASGSFFPGFLPFFDALQFLVNANGDVLHHKIGDAQTALELLDCIRLRRELQQDVLPLVVLRDTVGELANSPLINLVERATGVGDHVL